MSTLESILWHILGYSAIPIIVLVGFALSAAVGFLLLELSGRRGDD